MMRQNVVPLAEVGQRSGWWRLALVGLMASWLSMGSLAVAQQAPEQKAKEATAKKKEQQKKKAAAPKKKEPYKATEEDLRQIREKLAELKKAIDPIRDSKSPYLVDVLVLEKGAQRIVEFPAELYEPKFVQSTFDTIEEGKKRAKALQEGGDQAVPYWANQPGKWVLGYRSAVDNSIQPFAVEVPEKFDDRGPMRLDLNVHGRDGTITEVKFFGQRNSGPTNSEADKGKKPSTDPKPPEGTLVLHVFGRGNNAYRWGGETDVYEALQAVQDRFNVDPNRIVLRGFSMGGAGAWQSGLHKPSMWGAVEAGAGFTDTIRFTNMKEVDPFLSKMFCIYDAQDYATNVRDVPTVGYGGEVDKQLQASVNVRENLAKAGVKFDQKGLDYIPRDLDAIFIVGPKAAHKFIPESKKISEEFITEQLAKGPRDPHVFDFITYTTRYGKIWGVTITGLAKHYSPGRVVSKLDGNDWTMTTTGITGLSIAGDKKSESLTLTVDGKQIPTPKAGETVALEMSDDGWRISPKEAPVKPRKTNGLQGPIDDAFLDKWELVEAPGAQSEPTDPVGRYLAKTHADAEFVWRRWMRGEEQVIPMTDSENEVRTGHLAAWGTPKTHPLVAKAVKASPIEWTEEEIIVGDHHFPAKNHVVRMIYPDPDRDFQRYIVVNSGLTMSDADFFGTNANLYPHLGDWAVVKVDEEGKGEVVATGLFNEEWQLPAASTFDTSN